MDEISTLYYKKPQKHLIIYIVFIVSISVLIYISIKYYTYDTKELILIQECEEECHLKTTLNYEEQTIFEKDTIIKYKNKNYKIDEINYEEPYLVNGIPVSDVIIKTNINDDKKVLKIEVKYHKQRIINKIKEILIERK
ncbi:MAG: hypothetical protein II625_01020 [Bacilli bacterium]|nr:hypothetical protein [Bacilli bacterium]